GPDHDYPQYGRGGRDGRPRDRPVQGPQDGRGRRAVAVREPEEQLHARAVVGAARQCHGRSPADHFRHAVRAGRIRYGGRIMTAVLEGKNIVRDYHDAGSVFRAARTVHAVKGVSFSVEKGKTLAIVGESGCGKSTLARIITLIDPATAGDLFIDGHKVDIAKESLSREMRRKVQIVFQNPYG